MSKWTRARGSLLLASCLALPCFSTSAHASQEAAKRYFQNGVELITAAQPNYQDAYYQFQLAYQESAKSWKVLGNLGLCALKLERDQEALAYYEQYFEKGRGEIAAEERNAIEQDLMLLKGNLATVHVSSPSADLKVLDQRAGSSAPAQQYSLQGGKLDLQLRAGNHSITAVSGDRRLTWDVVLEPKSTASHVFDFDAPVAAATPAPAPASEGPAAHGSLPPDADRPTHGSSDLRTGGYVALGVGAVGVGLGSYFLWQSADYSSQSDSAFACNVQTSGCSVPQQAEVGRLEDLSSSAKTRGAISLGLGGAALVAGIVFLVVAPSSSSSDASRGAQLTPWIGYRSAGLSGSF